MSKVAWGGKDCSEAPAVARPGQALLTANHRNQSSPGAAKPILEGVELRAGIHTLKFALADSPGIPWMSGDPVPRSGRTGRRKLPAGGWTLTGAPGHVTMARADFDLLLDPADLTSRAVEGLEAALRDTFGLRLGSEPRIAQADVAVDLRFAVPGDGRTLLRRLSEAELPRLTRGTFERRSLQSVDWRRPRAGTIVARAYDHGAGHAGRRPYASPGAVVRIEVVARPETTDRPAVSALSGRAARQWAAEMWIRRCKGLAASVDGKLLRAGESLMDQIFGLADAGLISPSKACRFLGASRWAASGRTPDRGVSKTLKLLRDDHGIRPARRDHEQVVELGLSDLLARVRGDLGIWESKVRWCAQDSNGRRPTRPV